ncbi:MAG: aromatic ring-hydroxylating dioxygenase subunit alpha [Alphaproteobacteria bacterium]
MAKLTDFMDAADLDALLRPTDRAEGLPGRAYGEAFYALERERLFPHLWAPIGVGARVPEPGDVQPVDYAGWPLLMVRDKDRAIRCFYNVCRHRGMRLVHTACTEQTSISCPWHGWTYGLDGALIATPRLGGERDSKADGFDRTTLGLKEVPTGQWLDYVFVNLDGNAPLLDAQVGPLKALLSGIELEGLEHGGESWSHSYPGNWKIAVEGAIEDYHLPWGHADAVRDVLSYNERIDCGPGFAAISQRMELKPGREYGVATRNRDLPSIPRTPALEPDRGYIINLFPVGIMAVIRDHVMLGLFTPEGADRTRIEFDLYFPRSVARDPTLAPARRRIIDGWAHIAGEDTRFVRGVQMNLAARDAAGIATRFSPYWETAIHAFQAMVVDAVR